MGEDTEMYKTETIICFGDSNTYGYNPASLSGDSYPEQETWTGILGAQTGIKVLNYGVCGRRIPDGEQALEMMCSLLDSLACEPAPALLCIMLGSNDLLQDSGCTAENAGRRMERLLTVLMGTEGYRSGRIRILLISPPHLEYGTWVNEVRLIRESERLDGVYTELAERLGIYCAVSGNWDILLSYDGVHMTPEGHRSFAAGVKHILEQID